MVHSTVNLVMPWFLGSTSTPSPSAHCKGRGWGSQVKSVPTLHKGDECTCVFQEASQGHQNLPLKNGGRQVRTSG